QRARNPGEEPRRQALLVLQHEALVGRIAKQFFHCGCSYQCFGGRAIARRGAWLRRGMWYQPLARASTETATMNEAREDAEQLLATGALVLRKATLDDA